MNHPLFAKGATARGIQVVLHVHQVADRHNEPVVRRTLSGAIELIVGLIEDRARRHDFDDQRDNPHDLG